MRPESIMRRRNTQQLQLGWRGESELPSEASRAEARALIVQLLLHVVCSGTEKEQGDEFREDPAYPSGA